jgi:hypothetical protein
MAIKSVQLPGSGRSKVVGFCFLGSALDPLFLVVMVEIFVKRRRVTWYCDCSVLGQMRVNAFAVSSSILQVFFLLAGSLGVCCWLSQVALQSHLLQASYHCLDTSSFVLCWRDQCFADFCSLGQACYVDAGRLQVPLGCGC